MRSTPICAIDSIIIAAPASRVWRVLKHVGGYPQWWPLSLGLRILSDQTDTLGAEIEIRPLGGRPFRCRVENVDELKSLQIRYFGGFIEGTGEWRLEPVEEGTRVSYHLDARAHGWLVAFLGRVIDLAGFHSRSMQRLLLNLEKTTLEQLK